MLTLRPATESDAAIIHALWRKNPVGGQVPYYFDAAPFCKPGYRLYLIQWEGRPVGSISLCPEGLAGHRALYVSDVVVESSMRGRGLSILALSRLLNETLTQEFEFLTAVYSEDNDGPRRVLRSRRFKILYEAPYELFYLPALAHGEPRVTSDYAQVCELVNRFYAGHSLFEPLAPEMLVRREDWTILAEHVNGRIVACVGVWRQQRIRRLMLVHPRLGIRAALQGISLVNPHLDVSADNATRELVVHVLTEPAFAPGYERSFHRLLGQVGWRRDAHCFQLAAHRLCPIAAEARRRLGFRFRSVLAVFQTAEQSGRLPIGPGPAYHDCSLV
jgi:hypothetical protein